MAIIVATALGPHDHEARELAGILAKRMGETIILAHVLEQHEPPPHVMREMLDRATHEITRFGASAYHVLLCGEPTTALTEYARRVRPKLIVIGGPAPSDPRGSGQRRKARHLIDALHVPVLCVPHAGELLRMLLDGERFRVLVSCAHNAKADGAMLNAAHALRQDLPCDVSVLRSSLEQGGARFAARLAKNRRYDLLVLDASLLESETAWPFPDAAKPMLFVTDGPRQLAEGGAPTESVSRDRAESVASPPTGGPERGDAKKMRAQALAALEMPAGRQVSSADATRSGA